LSSGANVRYAESYLVELGDRSWLDSSRSVEMFVSGGAVSESASQ